VTVIINNEIRIRSHFFKKHGLSVGRNAYATEYYHPNNNFASLFVSAEQPSQPELIHINVDCIDGLFNIIKRYKVDTYTGQYVILNHG
jgi:hypothetical protein